MRHLLAHAVGVLRGGVEGVVIFGRVVVADGDARLHRNGRHAVVLDAQLYHVPGTGEGRISCFLVAEHQPEPDIALRAVFPDLRRALFRRVLEIDHGRQLLVLDLHLLCRVAGLSERLCNHEGHAVADKPRLVAREYALKGAVPFGRAEILGHEMSGEAAELLRRSIGAGDDAEHPWSGAGRGHVHALDARMRVR